MLYLTSRVSKRRISPALRRLGIDSKTAETRVRVLQRQWATPVPCVVDLSALQRDVAHVVSTKSAARSQAIAGGRSEQSSFTARYFPLTEESSTSCKHFFR